MDSIWTPEGQELEAILAEQGRKVEWFAEKMGITRGYLYRIRICSDHKLSRPTPPGFWERAESVLGVEAGRLTRASECAEERRRVPRLATARRKPDRRQAQQMEHIP